MSTKRVAVLVLLVATVILAGTVVAQGPPDDVDTGPPDDVDAGPPDDVEAGPPDDVTRGPSENVTVGPPEGVAEFVGTSPLTGDQVDPNSLSGKIRVEDEHLDNTTTELVRNSSTEFSLDITVTGNATNVTFFLNKQAVEASQDIENVTMEVDGEPAEFGVNDSGGANWIVFEIEHFSTRTVAFTESVDGGGDDAPDVGDGAPDEPSPGAGLVFDNNGDPLGELQIIDKLVEWNNTGGEIAGEQVGELELVDMLVAWNGARG